VLIAGKAIQYLSGETEIERGFIAGSHPKHRCVISARLSLIASSIQPSPEPEKGRQLLIKARG
jgi:hypothetical protein